MLHRLSSENDGSYVWERAQVEVALWAYYARLGSRPDTTGPRSYLVRFAEIRPNAFGCSSCRGGCHRSWFCSRPLIRHSHAGADEPTGYQACVSSFHMKLAGNRLGAQKPE